MPRRPRRSALIAALVIVAAACERRAAYVPTTVSGTAEPMQVATLPLGAAQWVSLNKPDGFFLGNDANGHLSFIFPERGTVNYVYTDTAPKAIRGTLSITLQVSAPEGVVFNYAFDQDNTCPAPASVRPFIWAHGHSLGNQEYDRWWANRVSFPLQPGSTTLTVPLTPDHWSSVFGRLGSDSPETEEGFRSALADVTSLGVTFGGGCYFGHGVNTAGGRAAFTILRYQITSLGAP